MLLLGTVPSPTMNQQAAGRVTGSFIFDEVLILTIPDQRTDYSRFSLREDGVDPDPIRQFASWFAEATTAGVPEPNAMTLATCTTDGRPSARVVLLRGIDDRGFAFFTNYESRKARELEINPWAALVFFWQELERQVRVEGQVERVSEEESDRYFRSRPASSRIGAWASPQSQVIASREQLEKRYGDLENRFADDPTIPRPIHWGGYRLVPLTIEFWQGRPSRLHDRLRYTRRQPGDWFIERLAP
jgi:pyridoxamine 5'-phosphate oxidase